jgi:hypothetical protein
MKKEISVTFLYSGYYSFIKLLKQIKFAGKYIQGKFIQTIANGF